MQVKLLVEGGSMKPGPALSQKLGPLGININHVIQQVNDSTKSFEGLKVPVELEINASTKKVEVKVFSPPVSELLKREMKIEKGSGAHKKIQVANASIEQIIAIAKMKSQNLLSRDLKSAVKTIIGTCASLGILVENKPAKEVEKEIEEGIYDKEIKHEATEMSQEKRERLAKYFSEVKERQEKLLKQEEAAALAEKEKAEAEAKTSGTAKPEEKAEVAKPAKEK
ncbi:MAG TPA: 50S ribosomal protein L11 [Patescibacteria group bacterium]|nr:50S ribosomal protein L11 [Patescibacteria group bacterium]